MSYIRWDSPLYWLDCTKTSSTYAYPNAVTGLITIHYLKGVDGEIIPEDFACFILLLLDKYVTIDTEKLIREFYVKKVLAPVVPLSESLSKVPESHRSRFKQAVEKGTLLVSPTEYKGFECRYYIYLYESEDLNLYFIGPTYAELPVDDFLEILYRRLGVPKDILHRVKDFLVHRTV